MLLALCWLAAGVASAQVPDPQRQALGSQAAATAQARRFLAGRQGAIPASSPSISSTQQPGASARKSLLSARPAAIADLAASWTPLGPATVTSALYGAVTGRVTSVALDPNDITGNTVWLGTTGGGVWRSTNAAGPQGSVTFKPLTDTLPVFAQNAGTAILPSLSIGTVAVQPSANPVVLAGTGDPNESTDSYYGEGILRSADNGQTWTLAVQSSDGVNGNHSLAGLATAGLAWSSATPSLVVAAMTTSAEGATVGVSTTGTTPGLYYSSDAGQTWHMAMVRDGTQYIQYPSVIGTALTGAPATSVVWSPQRQLFLAAIQFHGYFSSPDGQNWTRLTHQPGTGLTTANCPSNAIGQGSINCPMLRGTLAVQPTTGDLYAFTIDANDNDDGIWQDLCNIGSNGQCNNTAPTFTTRIDAGALEVGQGAAGSSTQIPQGSYNLSLAAVPSSAGTLLFAGALDLYRCVIAPGASTCNFRNTTNAGDGCNAPAAVAPAQHALAGLALGSGGPLLYIGNDGGLWRSTDGIAQTGSACASTDAAHFQNLNAAVGSGGSLAEIVGFAQDPSQNSTLLAGLGTLGSAASTAGTGTAAWPQLSGGEGGFPLIDQVSPANWYVSIGAGVNLKSCTLGAACTAANFAGSADIGAIQTAYDAALLDAPVLLDPQAPTNLLTGTCRTWRGPAGSGSAWNSLDALSPAFDNAGTPCTTSSALIRSLGAGGPVSTSGATPNLGSKALYAGMAGSLDGGGTLPGHVFFTKSADTASASHPWIDITGSPVQNDTIAFNASGFDISSVVVDPHDSTGATVYATVMGFGSGSHVYRSLDFGAHWNRLDANLPLVPANALVVDPNDANTVYVAMDTGVYATQAVATCLSQNCWSLLGSALPNAPVTGLQAGAQLPTGDGRVGMLRAGTYGRGLWETPLLTAHSTLQPELSASPSTLSFLSQPVQTQSDALSVTLLSYGNAPVQITSVVITGDFVETDTCAAQTLAVGANCTISVRFAPTATGGRSGLLTVYGNIPGGQVTVALSGTGTAPPSVVLTPLQVSFAPTLVHQTTASQIVTISNTGGNPATLQTPTITGDFTISANTCGTSLPSQVGCSIAITFTPTASGSRTGVLTVVDSAGTQTAQLIGTGQSPATDTLNPASLTFGQQQTGTTSAAQQVTLTNAGDVPLTLVTAVVTGGDFAATNSCGTSLAAHSSCAVNVVFVPTAVGTRTGTLQVTDQFRIQTVPLSGSGLAPAGVSLSPSVVSFGAVGVGLNSASTPVVLTNNGGEPLLLTSTKLSGDFKISSSTCSTSLLPGTACTFNLFLAPSTPGPLTGTLALTDNTTPGTQTVSLSGTGIDFTLAGDGPTSQSVTSGTVATFPLLLNSVGGISGAVALTCGGAPTNTVCTVNPASAQLGGSVPVSVTLQTGLSTSAHQAPEQQHSHTAQILLCFFAIPITLFSARSRERLRRPSLMLLQLAAFSLAMSLLSGCGSTRLIPLGGTGGGGTGIGGSAPTSPGTYPLTITGTCDGVTHTLQLSLTVN